MKSLDSLLHPVPVSDFLSQHRGIKPLYIPAETGGGKRGLLDWASFNALLSQADHWTSQTLRLVSNGTALAPSEYCQSIAFPGAPIERPVPARVSVLMAGGASLIANEVQTLHPPIAAVALSLSRAFAARVGANVYCSFKDVQAFRTHFDSHDVLAVQTEGEKLWRIYETQLDQPIELPPDSPDTRRWLEQARGPLAQEVLMRPGDVLYLPRGRFHDALAVDAASLHVTFSVTPLHGKSLLSLLDNAAPQLSAFRSYFPSYLESGGEPLASHLQHLGALLKELVCSRAFFHEVAMAQERLTPRLPDYALPAQIKLTLYKPTGEPFPAPGGPIEVLYDWCKAQTQFAIEDLISQFDFIEPGAIRAAVEAAARAGSVTRLSPPD